MTSHMNRILHRAPRTVAPLLLLLPLLLFGALAGQARAELVITNWTMTNDSITFDIAGTIDADAVIGPFHGHRLFIGVAGNTDWVNGGTTAGSITNHAGATRDLTGQQVVAGSGAYSDSVRLETLDGEPFAPGDVIDASVVIAGSSISLTPANLVKEDLIVSAGFSSEGGTAYVPQAAHQVGAYEPPPPPTPTLIISNWSMTDDTITFDIAGTIDADAVIGPTNPQRLFIGVTGNTDWVNGSSVTSGNSITNHAGATRDIAGVGFFSGSGELSDYVAMDVSSALEPGDVIDASVVITGPATSPLNGANLVKEDLIVSAGRTTGGGAASVPQLAHLVGAYGTPPPPPSLSAPDTIRPTIRFLNQKNLRSPRPRHRIRGSAHDNDALARVELKARGSGYKRARLRPSGRWVFRTERLKSGNNVIRARAVDVSGNRSKVKRVRARGR